MECPDGAPPAVPRRGRLRIPLPRWRIAPDGASPVQRRNFLNVQIDGIGIGIASAASAFLAVFLARLGASGFQISLLTAMPALIGLVFALPIGRFIQERRNIVPWFSAARATVISAYALTGLVPFLLPRAQAITAVLVVWASVTIPQTAVNVSFSVVMNAVAGPDGRYFLMSRRWAVLGVSTAVVVAVVGRVLDSIAFPINYQAVFLCLSLGGLVSFTFSRRIVVPDSLPQRHTAISSPLKRLQWYARLVAAHPAFLSFMSKRFVFTFGVALAAPLFPVYFVRVVGASDTWIGTFNTIQTAVMTVGYFFWSRVSRKRGSRACLMATTCGLAVYPLGIALTRRVEVIAGLAGVAGFFQSGLDLVFFDELMKRVPDEYAATFVAIAQLFAYCSSIVAPPLGSLLADLIGLGGGLAVSAAVRFAGFLLFALAGRAVFARRSADQ